ncbi:MAG: nickel-dependent hydrogenase large subunit [Burkholderiaceae bacterium]|nr:nickel-dependent hydrogenase large subunit [Burkholderiaceae bacterium]
MNPEGDIVVRLARRDQRVRDVGVASSRTGLPPHLVRGKPAVDVRRLIPLLFSICSRAQGAAAAAAISAAQGVPAVPAETARQELEVMLETLQETIWRLLIDWPRTMGEASQVPPVALVRRAADAVTDNGVTLDAMLAVVDMVLLEHVYGDRPDAWLGNTDLQAYDQWVESASTLPARLLRRLRDEAPGLGRSDVALMPDATLENLVRAVIGDLDLDPQFVRTPRWSGRPAETGALARQQAAPLVAQLLAREGRTAATRFAARLVELATIVDQLRSRVTGRLAPVRSHALAFGLGLGLAETARGLLLHRARVEQGLVTDYRIVAPTEWNFHPAGPLAQGLLGRPADDAERLEREARTVVQSLDPCVSCRVELADA